MTETHNKLNEKEVKIHVEDLHKSFKNLEDRVIFMADGLILEEGTPEEVFKNPKNPRTVDFLDKVLGI